MSIPIPNLLIGLKVFLDMFVLFLLPIYLTDIGLSGLYQGIVLSLLTVTALLTTFITGIGNDRLSTKKFIITGFFLSSIYYYGIGFTTKFTELFILFFIGGIGSNLVYTSINSLVFKTHQEKKKGSSFGSYWFYRTFFAASGILVGAYLVMTLSFITVFKMVGIGYIFLLFFAFILKDTVPSKTSIIQYSKDFFQREILLLSLILFLYALHWGAETSSYGLFLKNNLKLTHMKLSAYMALPIFFLSLIARYLGQYIDNYGNDGRIFIAGLFFSGIGHFLMVYPVFPVSFFFRFVHEMGDGIVVVYSYVKMSQIFSRTRVGGNTGIVTTIMVFGHFTGTLIFSPLGASMGSHVPFMVSGSAAMFAAVLAVYSKLVNPDHYGDVTALWKGMLVSLFSKREAKPEIIDDLES